MDTIYTLSETGSVAKELLASLDTYADKATVLGLSGDLGAGKTTLVQAIAQELGVTNPVVSPTFVIAKFYETGHHSFKTLVHIDAYRIENTKELEVLGWSNLCKQPNNLIIVEWAERIKKLLPENTLSIAIDHKDELRHIHTL